MRCDRGYAGTEEVDVVVENGRGPRKGTSGQEEVDVVVEMMGPGTGVGKWVGLWSWLDIRSCFGSSAVSGDAGAGRISALPTGEVGGYRGYATACS